MTSLKDFTIFEELGAGAYSKVNRVVRKDDGQVYALKRVFLSKLSEKEKDNALNEVRILASVNSENVVSYKEAFWENSPSTLWIVMEYADGGDLYEKIKKHKKKGSKFAEEEIWRIFIQIVKGLKILHNHKVLHRDLKWANVFLNKDGTVKLGDLNVSKVAKMGLVYTQTGTPYYASPEVWQDKPYDSKSDIWSLGVVLYEMWTLNPPFTDTSMQGLCKRVMKGNYPAISGGYSKDLTSMISTLLQVTPTKRPSWSQILHMPAIDEHLNEEENNEIWEELLNTIKFPRNIKHLNNRLPKSQYELEEEEEEYQDDFTNNFKLETKNSQPILPIEPHTDNVPEDIKREIAKYEAIAEIERKYAVPSSKKIKKQRQIPKTTPSSLNGIQNIYMKYKDKAKGIAESIKKKNNYLQMKEKYAKRAKEVEEIEKKEKILLHKRVIGSIQNSEIYDSPGLYKHRDNFHYQISADRNQNYNANSKSEDYRDPVSHYEYNPTHILKPSYKSPSTTKALDNMSIDDKETRKQRILQHAKEIREAVSLNREKATGMIRRISDQSAIYTPIQPKWWG